MVSVGSTPVRGANSQLVETRRRSWSLRPIGDGLVVATGPGRPVVVAGSTGGEVAPCMTGGPTAAGLRNPAVGGRIAGVVTCCLIK